MTVRAKFVVEEKTERSWTKGGVTLKLRAVSGGSEEDKKFFEATPSGTIEILIKSEASRLLELGKYYYVDFTPAGE